MTESTPAGALLAAGTSQRFGERNKLLAEIEGTPVVRRAATTLVEASLDGVVAVVGHEAAAVEGALDGLDIERLRNPEYAEGQATSVREAARWARRRDAPALVVALGDMPWVQPETIDELLAGWRRDHDIVVPTYDGMRGNPVLFDRTHFDSLAAVSGDSGGRQLFAGNPVHRIPVPDAGIRRDVDRPGDLES
ncbi:MAG: NTP transferase domain-containing protein [Halobacteriaceae archaeon]